jgi:hypothetical protein
VERVAASNASEAAIPIARDLIWFFMVFGVVFGF